MTIRTVHINSTSPAQGGAGTGVDSGPIRARRRRRGFGRFGVLAGRAEDTVVVEDDDLRRARTVFQHMRYAALRYVALHLHCMPSHYVALHYITLPLHYIALIT